jgi:hypothetical protein
MAVVLQVGVFSLWILALGFPKGELLLDHCRIGKLPSLRSGFPVPLPPARHYTAARQVTSAPFNAPLAAKALRRRSNALDGRIATS